MSQPSAILDPVRLGKHLLTSRIVFGAHTNNMAVGGEPSSRQIEYLRARNSAAMVVVEPIPIHPTTIFARGNLSGRKLAVRLRRLRELAAAVKENGAVGILQLIHLGQHGDGDVSFHPNWSPSGLPSFIGTAGSHVMDTSQIEEIIEGFVQGATLAQAAGFDGIELFANYQGLIEQFWSPWTNRRQDEWGGSFEGRLRFSTEVLGRIKRICGDEFIAGMAISHLDAPGVTLSLEELVSIASWYDQANLIDYVTCGTGGYLDTSQLVPAAHRGATLGLPLASALKRAGLKALVQAESGFRSVQEAEGAIARGDTDLVSMVRAQIAEPDFVAKLRTQDTVTIRPCLGCNQKCIGRRSRDRWISCVVNPIAGREFSVKPAAILKSKRKVVVVGAGPAGLEFASQISLRGSSVVIYERSSRLGGLPAIFGQHHLQSRWKSYIDWLGMTALRKDVVIHTDCHVTEDDADAFDADAVIWASGAIRNSALLQRSAPAVPEISAGQNAMDVTEALAEPSRVGVNVLFIDDHHGWPGLGAALQLAERGRNVTLATGQPFVGRDLIPLGVHGDLRKAFASAGGIELTDTHLSEWDDGHATLSNRIAASVRRTKFDTLVWASVPIPTPSATHRSLKPEHHFVIGDAFAPRDAAAAIYDANELARSLWQ